MADLEALAPLMGHLDRAMVELAVADPDDTLTAAHLEAVVDAWLDLPPDAQASKLHYFRSDRPYGAKLRAALLTVAHAGDDLGARQADLDAMKGRPWP